jgi:hypothetical protein
LGIGYGTGMTNTDMNIVEFLSDGKYTLTDAYSTGYEQPAADTTKGGANSLINITYNTSGTSPILRYERKLNTGDQYDKVIALENNSLILAWGIGRIAFHEMNRASNTFSITDDFLPDTNPTTAGPNIYDVHGISLFISWGLLNFFGYCAARFFKHHPWWMYVHLFCTQLPGLWTFAMIIATLAVSKFFNNI